jgi:hypothetical protein
LGNLRKAVISVLVAAAMSSFLWPAYIHVAYSLKMPSSPQPSQGRIYRIVVNHGSVVYVNEIELRRADFAFNTIFLIGIVCVGLLGIVVVYWNSRTPLR